MWGRIRSASEAKSFSLGVVDARIRTRCSPVNGAMEPARLPNQLLRKVLVLTMYKKLI